jgi:hypothetical protein
MSASRSVLWIETTASHRAMKSRTVSAQHIGIRRGGLQLKWPRATARAQLGVPFGTGACGAFEIP